MANLKDDSVDPLRPDWWIAHTQLLLDSYTRWTGLELITQHGSPRDVADALFEAPRVVVSHTPTDDPVLNYGNRRALELWEMDIPTLLSTPSRLTAEPMHRDERSELLARTTRNGYVDDYRGIRISRSGRRFLIERATVWNLVDPEGVFRGQAATFTQWTPLEALSPGSSTA